MVTLNIINERQHFGDEKANLVMLHVFETRLGRMLRQIHHMCLSDG